MFEDQLQPQDTALFVLVILNSRFSPIRKRKVIFTVSFYGIWPNGEFSFSSESLQISANTPVPLNVDVLLCKPDCLSDTVTTQTEHK